LLWLAAVARLGGSVCALATLAVPSAHAATTQQPPPAPTRPPTAYEELQAFSSVLTQIRVNYVDSVTYRELVHAAIDGMLHALDPHSRFMSRTEWERQEALLRGELPGIGVQVEEEDSAATVLAVDPRAPAARAGVQPGDRIAAINDSSVAGLKPADVALRLTGPKGSTVRIRIERGPRLEPDTLSVTLRREPLSPPPATMARMVAPGTGYLGLTWFSPKAGDDLRAAVGRLQAQGARRLVLDLRNNPGGLMDAAVDIASEFLPKGALVFRTEGRKKDGTHRFVTERNGRFRELPVIVLINGHSASAAEALAGSLQDHDRALIVGRRSFGKALVQTGFLVMPSADMVELTIARVFTPSGRVIQRRYRGIRYEQYWAFAGKAGAPEDTLAVFKTDHGRTVRGGGGIVPDVVLPLLSGLPVWWSVSMDSGFADAVADSVALSLPATAAARVQWLTDRQQWHDRLLVPWLERVRSRLHVSARLDSALSERVALSLAARAATVRWPPDGGDELGVRNDSDIRAALEFFARLPDLLGTPAR
jgi:carboxyl-terminal processing protease